MDPFKTISDLLSGIPSIAVLRERLALVNEKLQALAEEKVKLEAKCAGLVERNRELEGQLEAQRPREDYEKTEKFSGTTKPQPVVLLRFVATHQWCFTRGALRA